ncbi:hypothetical protein OIO90_001672 [Microbotryomycetes sp. JL221]|nr:hypothetical protein OIO90_001672 [Microbotryomycetes sp. JL221]
MSVPFSKRIRIPGLGSQQEFIPAPDWSLQRSIQQLVQHFKQFPNTCIVTGAGLSVDSGIRAYRGQGGSYTVNKKHRPIFYQEFIDEESKRRRYWARSYLGYPPVREAEPNPGHYAIAALMKLGYVSSIITQNVDGLHHKAHDSDLTTYHSQSNVPKKSSSPPIVPTPPILELHGTLRHAGCLNCGHLVQRDSFQDRLNQLNPKWKLYSDQVRTEQIKEKLNPDGDVELGQGVRYEEFNVPPCDQCGGSMKPKVTFFGESLEPQVRELSTKLISDSSSVVVIGSSLATFSAFRLIKLAKEQSKIVGLVNVGQTRGDNIVDWRVGWQGGITQVLPPVVETLLNDETQPSTTLNHIDTSQETRQQVKDMLTKGIVKRVSAGSGAA